MEIMWIKPMRGGSAILRMVVRAEARPPATAGAQARLHLLAAGTQVIKEGLRPANLPQIGYENGYLLVAGEHELKWA